MVKNMCMLDIVRAKSGEIRSIARKHQAEKVWLFGSCARKEERPDSDVDFLVKFREGASLFNLGGMNADVSRMLGRKVDVVEYSAIEREPFFAYTVRKDLMPL